MASSKPRSKSVDQSVVTDDLPASAEPLNGKDKARQGGPEDLIAPGKGGTRPLKGFEPPHYYSADRKP